MGDSSRGSACDKFIAEFGDDVIRLHRSALFDKTFGDKVSYYVGVDDVNWVTTLCATIKDESGDETFVLTVEGNLFYPDWVDEDMIKNIAVLLDLTEEDAQRRLVKAGLLEAGVCTCTALGGKEGCPTHDENPYAIGRFLKFSTEYAVTEQERNGQRCKIVAVAPGPEPAEGDEDFLIEFDDGHQYEAYLSEVQEPWVTEPTVDYAGKRVGSPHVEDVVGGRAKCGICGYIDDADPEDPIVKEWHGDSFAEVEVKATVTCKLCHKQVPAKTAHLHQGEYICDEWCWDERLKSTE